MALALARQKPDEGQDAAAAEAYKAAGEKLAQLFKAQCLHARALHLKFLCTPDGADKNDALATLNSTLIELDTRSLVRDASSVQFLSRVWVGDRVTVHVRLLSSAINCVRRARTRKETSKR